MLIITNILILVYLYSNAFANTYFQEKSSILLEKDILVIRTEGVAFLGSGMNEYDAKTLAINDAKRNALEQAGTYLESHTTVLNYQLVKDEIITFSAGLLKVKVINEVRTLVNNMFAFKVDVETTIDIKILEQRIKEIREDHGLREKLKIERLRIKQLEARIAELQESNRKISEQDVKNVINELSATEWFEKGYNIKDDIHKVIYYSEAIALAPNYIAAYNYRGIAYSNLGKYAIALKDFNRALELSSKDAFVEAIVYYNIGLNYSRFNKHENAIQAYNKSIELNPQNDDAYCNRGAVYANLGEYTAAIKDFSRAIDLNPQIENAYIDRAACYTLLGNYDAAISNCSKALELNPQNAGAYMNRGAIYFNLGKYAAAIQDYNKSIEYEPEYADVYFNRGSAYRKLGNYEMAIIDYNKSIELNPQYADAYYYRGIAYKNLNNNRAAYNDYSSYLRINGNKDGRAEKVRQWIRDLGYTPKY